MRLTYDEAADAAYLYLKDIVDAGEACVQLQVGQGAAGEIVLDLDAEGRLIGIEILDAKRGLPEEVIRQAERL